MIEVNKERIKPRQRSAFVRFARSVYAFAAGLFVGAIILQVFLAGAGVLVHPRYWPMHIACGQMITSFPVFMLVTGLIARLPWRMLVLTALLFVLFVLQYLFLWVLPNVVGIVALRALHAVNALAFFWIAVYLACHAWRLLRAPRFAAHVNQPMTIGTAQTTR